MVGRIDKKHKGKGKLVVAPGTGRLFKSMQKAKDRYDTQFSKLSEHMSSSYEKKQHKANAAPPPRETVVHSGETMPFETGAPPPPEARVTLPLRGSIVSPRGAKEILSKKGKVQYVEPPPKMTKTPGGIEVVHRKVGLRPSAESGREVATAPKKNVAPEESSFQTKPKKTISPEHLAKMAAGRARAKAEKDARK